MSAASDEVVFPGAIYEAKRIRALRFFARVYVHGHQVGGTNPSLVEALGAGNAVLAHDNKFNRWVAKDGAIYFNGVSSARDAFVFALVAALFAPIIAVLASDTACVA